MDKGRLIMAKILNGYSEVLTQKLTCIATSFALGLAFINGAPVQATTFRYPAAMAETPYRDNYTSATFIVEGSKATMIGDIDSQLPNRVRELYENHPEVTTIVMQEVLGSIDDEANLAAARLVRLYGFNTWVPEDGLIASGGVDFFLAGVERTVESGAMLGVHSWGADDFTGAELPRDDPAHDLFLDYYSEMGIPTEFYWFTLEAAPFEDVHFMTPEEIAQYKITTEHSNAEKVPEPSGVLTLGIFSSLIKCQGHSRIATGNCRVNVAR